MAKLVVFLDSKVVGEYSLSQARISIGRKPGNDIVLNHPTVSGEHALLTAIRQDWYLEDLGSTNGTFVNQKLVKKCLLADGDDIRIGKYILKYLAEPGAGRFEDTTLAGYQAAPPGSEPPPKESAGQEESARTATQPVTATLREGIALHRPKPNKTGKGAGEFAALQILSGPGTGSELMLDRALTTLGKPGVQVAVITRRDHGYFFTHVEGDAFPLINGKPTGIQSRALKAHDIIELAETRMEFFYK